MKKKLTNEQQKAISAFEQALENLVNAGVVLVRNNDDDSITYYNGDDIKEFVSYDEKDFYPEAVDITDDAADYLGCIIDHAYYPNFGQERVLAILK